MEHSSHAHPLPDGHTEPSSRWSLPSDSAANSSPLAVSQQQDGPINQQARRLQLRNNGFRGPILPFRRISPLLGASPNGIEPFTHAMNDENSPLSGEKRSLYGELLPQNPVNILQEIHKMSTKKKRSPVEPGSGAIFEDDTAKEGASGTSWYNGGSSDCSPAAMAVTPAKRRQLREVSRNQRTPSPLVSPSIKHVKGPTNRRNIRSTSSGSAQYIEHLESELASALAKLDLQPSPKTSKLRAAKLKALTTENRNLKHEISDWQKDFDSRVQEERAKRMDADLEMKHRIRMMEDALELKDARMAELEWELESLRVRLRDLEGLEAINYNLEKRIEALTNLLVQSPTKLELSSFSSSPLRTDPPKRTPRPRSMLSRFPTSPPGICTSLPTVSESAYGRSQSLGAFPDGLDSPQEQGCGLPATDDAQSPTCVDDSSPDVSMRQSGSTDRRSRASMSYRSAPSPTSRRTSMRSSCSFAPVMWGMPDQEHRSGTKSRRMRRFPSGSNTLKPLILPATKDRPSASMESPIFASIDGVVPCHSPSMLCDPKAVSTSVLENNHPLEHPRRQRSTTSAREETLRALEGKLDDDSTSGGTTSRIFQSPLVVAEEELMGFRKISTEKRNRRSRPRSLQKELEEAEVSQSPKGPSEAINIENRKDCFVAAGGDASLSTISHLIDSERRCQTHDTDPTPKPAQKQPPLPICAVCSAIPNSSTVLTNEDAHGICSRLVSMITRMKQDALILAQRLLYNAWSLSSRQLGGIGWWLLGVVYGTRWRKRRRKADLVAAEDASTTRLDHPYLSAEVLRRDVEHQVKRANKNRESWLSPPHVSRVIQPIAPLSNSESPLCYFPCDKCVEPSSRRTFRLWLKFSLAIILAVGMAVKNGPERLLTESEDIHLMRAQRNCETGSEPLLQEQHRRQHAQHAACHSNQISQLSTNTHNTHGLDSGYGSIASTKNAGSTDSGR